MSVVFTKSTTFPPTRQTWFRAPNGGTVLIGCPTCGQAVGVGCPPHLVKPDGAVLPSYVCAHKCGFHDMIQLEGLEVPEGTCPTCAHTHVDRCPPPCDCMAGTPEGRPQPVAHISKQHRILLGAAEGRVLIGIGDETALSVMLEPQEAESLARHLVDLARQVRG